MPNKTIVQTPVTKINLRNISLILIGTDKTWSAQYTPEDDTGTPIGTEPRVIGGTVTQDPWPMGVGGWGGYPGHQRERGDRMTTETPTPTPRPINVEDVQRMIGAMALEIEMLRRENAALRESLNGKKE